MRRVAVSAWAALSVLLSVSATVHAQDASASETAAARELFQEGVAALGEERWADALDRFERSYALVPRSSTLLNIATAQAELGRIVAAVESYRRFVAEATGRQRRHRADATRAIEELEPRIAHVELTIPTREPDDVVRLDGRELSNAALDVALPLDPGDHRLTVTRGADEIGAVDLVLVEGERRRVELALHPPAPAPEPLLEPEPPAPAPDDSGLWIGLGIGGGVLVLAAVAIVLGVALSGGEDAFVGNLGPGMVTF